MRLILHIGTHKTGTTAVQQFLRDNRTALEACGIHYGASGGGLNANVVANAIALDDLEVARDFFRREVANARERQAETLVVSAENFYCMTLVGAVLGHRAMPDLGDSEPQLVRRLHDLVPAEVSDVRVAAYFRRPDRFAESLYNQRVKYETFHEPFDQYLSSVEPMFHYARIASAWADVFGSESCDVRTYEPLAHDLRAAFLRDVLGVDDPTGFVETPVRDNERISRDVLEFKRELNPTVSGQDQLREYRIACLLEQSMNLAASEPTSFREFFSPQARADFLDRWADETAALQEAFALAPFPPLEPASGAWTPYPGLPDQRRSELQRQHARISRRLRWSPARLPRAVRRVGEKVLRAGTP